MLAFIITLPDSQLSCAGTRLATASGDSTVKLWDLAAGTCVATLAEHGHAVWSVSFHHTGDFLASGSMDNTCKVMTQSTCLTVYHTLSGVGPQHRPLPLHTARAQRRCQRRALPGDVRAAVRHGVS